MQELIAKAMGEELAVQMRVHARYSSARFQGAEVRELADGSGRWALFTHWIDANDRELLLRAIADADTCEMGAVENLTAQGITL